MAVSAVATAHLAALTRGALLNEWVDRQMDQLPICSVGVSTLAGICEFKLCGVVLHSPPPRP